ncbi:hypothetical protein C4K22_5548 [Pseudomonas chlororaphis subsp. aurantiaca]|uniref:hypothetical protein n=1 Tax=Pseudomonas chlororaphis TaxID=587753 RepID=UPI000F5647A8|nr:hypothetical protein [Pseudomonas chlororaphis]AZD38256.1 hypothetical protein C4K22_5548 [Pseudomonas chlororaphis subsp. aurantiaca]AZD44597.1 hypothetical protein C4K21_5558 [Pseudomonas chlororaphis subsp. aurantiaca]AZD57155.1 hypothetical protein C4K19_5403 [Pseudomonas chlororaphis subsp. aurantiaca]
MDLRLPLAGTGLCIAVLLSSGCSPSDEKQQVSLEQKTAQFEQSLDAIQDPKLKDAIADLGGSLLLLERAQLRLKSKPIETEYGDDALALLKHYPSPQALVDTYLNGLFILRKTSNSDYLTDLQPVFPFNFNMPAQFPFPHGLEWQSVTLSNGKVIAFQPEWSETDPGIQLSPSSSNLTNPDDLTVTYPFIEGVEVENKNQPQPVTLQGKAEVIAPHQVLTFELGKADVGKQRSDKNVSVKLLSLDKNSAEIELTNNAPLSPELSETPLNPLLVQARDTTGQILSRSGSINENSQQIAFYAKQLAEMQKQKAWSQAFEQQLEEERKTFEREQHSHYTKVYFNGLIDKLEVNVLDFSGATVTRKDLNLPVRRFDPLTTDSKIQPLPMPVVVYDDQAPNYLKGANLDEDTLKKSVVVHQSAEDASAARIEFDHPKTFNDELLGTSFSTSDSPVTFFTQNENGKRGEPIELPSEAVEVDPLRSSITYDLTLFPETPAYAVGAIPLFLASIEKKALPVSQLPKGLELRGNALIVDQRLFPSEAWRFYAKDSSGQYLKEILAVSHEAPAKGSASFDVHYFYGQPTELETYQRSELNTVEYGFEVKLDKLENPPPAE